MTGFEEIINTVTTEDMLKPYNGISLNDWSKPRPDLDNHLMTPDEQRLNLAFYAKAASEHVGWSGFSSEHRQAFMKKIEELYNQISSVSKQKDFMEKVAETTALFMEDRHFVLATGSKMYNGGEKMKPTSVGRNIGYEKPETLEKCQMKLVDEEYGQTRNGEKYPLWRICTAKGRHNEDILIVSIPNLPDKNDYETSQKFIEAFDKIYLGDKEKWEKGRIILDVRGNGGGEDKPIDHVAKRLYGNLVNTYKRCEIRDTEISNAFLHRHGAYGQQALLRDGLSEDKIVKRKCFSGATKALFDETDKFYPFNCDKGYKGRIDILIDCKVGSSAESAYTSFYHHPNVRYIGEHTAGMQQFTQGSFAMPCGYMLRVGVTKLTYWDKAGENIEVKGHQPDVCCSTKDAMLTAFALERDEGRVMGVRETNEKRSDNVVFAEYDPKAPTDPRRAYYAKYLEPALQKVEQENILTLQQQRELQAKR